MATFFGVVAEVGEAGVDTEPRPNDAVSGVTIVRDTRRPCPPHAHANVVVFAVHTQPHRLYNGKKTHFPHTQTHVHIHCQNQD